MNRILLVTGGSGFLGKSLIRRLLNDGEQVRTLIRKTDAELAHWQVETFLGDLTQRSAVEAAMEGCELVFHVAAKTGIWGDESAFQQSNVVGTENILAACRSQGVRKLVYTSSPSVVFDGTDQEGVNESTPYPDHYLTAYPKTKAMAEQLVRAANDDRLATVCLRPHLIWGPGDRHLIPRILARGKAGRLRRLGSRNPLIDSIYIDNAVEAHVLASRRLAIGSPIAGQVYFISNGEPWPLWNLVNAILKAGGIPPVKKTLSPRLAYWLGWCCETLFKLFHIKHEPPMTRFLAKELSTAHWFDISAARRDLGYVPLVSMEEGLKRLRTALAGNEPASMAHHGTA